MCGKQRTYRRVFVCVAGKGLSGWERLFTEKSITEYIACQEQIQRWVAFQNGKVEAGRKVLGQHRTGYYAYANRNIRAYSLCPCYRFYRTVYCPPFLPVVGPRKRNAPYVQQNVAARRVQMLTRPVESWHCINPECAAKPTIRVDFNLENAPPRCLCGALMKKEYRSPVFRYLDFLRVEAAVEVEDAAEAAER